MQATSERQSLRRGQHLLGQASVRWPGLAAVEPYAHPIFSVLWFAVSPIRARVSPSCRKPGILIEQAFSGES